VQRLAQIVTGGSEELGLGATAAFRFEPGTRNHWHRHAGGQLLYVVEGEGWVQGRAEPPRRIRAGDGVSTGPGEEHWHGAGTGAPMAHLAVSIGDIAWLEPSEETPN